MQTTLTTPATPPTEQEREAQRIAREVEQILAAPRQTAERVVLEWERAFDRFWQGDVAAKLALIGTRGAALFSDNTRWTTALIGAFTGLRDDLVTRITDKLATLPAFTVGNDGTVTLN